MSMRRRSLATITVVLVFAAVYVWPARPFVLGMRQVRTIADGRGIAAQIEQYREEHGRYPLTLATALPPSQSAPLRKDGWGNRWVYITDGSAFLLLSFGRDGKPDRTDYRLLAGQGDIEFRSTCGDWDADQIISNRGIHQGCGK